MVLEALRSARSQAGLGLTRGSVGMRAIAPLLAESNNGPQQIGAIEVAMGVLEDLAQLDREFDSGVALLLRDDGLLTEGCFTNLFVERGGKLLTPPASLGLLPGVLRRSLLEQGRAEEAELTLDDLKDGFLIGNALRGLVPAVLL